MSTNEPTTETQLSPTERLDVELSRWQFDAVFRTDRIKWLFLIGGRGSGKSFIEKIRFYVWMMLSTELHWGIFGATEGILHTILAPFIELLELLRIDYRFETAVPSSWPRGWVRDGIKFPARRLRSHKMLVLENGAHFVTGSIINNAYTRYKSIEFNGVYIGECTEPGVKLDALYTLWGACRCGKARRGPDGMWRCREPGHLHQLVCGGNVPLNDPSHFIYKLDSDLQAKELQRAHDGKPPFYRRLRSATKDNPYTGENYDELLAAAWDAETYEQQTSGELTRNVALLSYHAFSEKNVLDTLRYDPRRPLHIWFDFNSTPAVAGWGHDLLYNEVPAPELRSGNDYFGVVGELFSGGETMVTEQVAYALLEDPTRDAHCADCSHELREHFDTGSMGFLCQLCAWQKGKSYCAGVAMKFDRSRQKFLHLDPDSKWRGLINHRNHIYVYGDATGRATHADGVQGGAIKILRDVFGANLGERVHFRFKDSNPPVRLRVLAMNRMLEAKNGSRCLFFGSWCVAHCDDGREVVPDPKTGDPKKVDPTPSNLKPGGYGLRTHAFDGLGYRVDYSWPAIIRPGHALPDMPDLDLGGPLETSWPVPR